MAGAPKSKFFDAAGKYMGSTKEYVIAAFAMEAYGNEATIRLGHNKRDTVWTEGVDGKAEDSYDAVAEAIHGRT